MLFWLVSNFYKTKIISIDIPKAPEILYAFPLSLFPPLLFPPSPLPSLFPPSSSLSYSLSSSFPPSPLPLFFPSSSLFPPLPSLLPSLYPSLPRPPSPTPSLLLTISRTISGRQQKLRWQKFTGTGWSSMKATKLLAE
jgi:hypothetical protein